ncbi:MAG: formate dehydrogenase subunit delta [Candidatus Methanoperedens nitroreducens]|uniref:Sulfur carrier protein FdhD n=1 Tax=Candidatus Methanoperedens nitratireducens TaxID=1392998 RepID=A0A0P8CJQ1_9EURY|nr:MAG: formate dehydrogenase subunit delta [Candidatus Methanoperedens sp. BLZ1]MCX9086721.1 formate dehydrogenase accessory sulfurtransferase FdhD [Candidatus Methanoperedens sp.]CAG0988317.1 Sulfur carrier protein FdhD [Methanosarcinales archaeon]
MYKKNYPALEFKRCVPVPHEKIHTVAIESTIEIFINKIPIASILATPEMIKELAIGYFICEGLVKDPDSIKDFKIDGNRIYAAIEETGHVEIWRELRSSGCVGVRWEENENISIDSDTKFSMDLIGKSLRFLESDIYRETRGTHAACLINARGECAAKAIDVGRHNAFDKVVGYAYLNGINVREHFIISTGRQSAGMVLKAARAGIPLVATKTAPLNSGIDAALRTGVCLVCFVSNDKMSVFSHYERLLFHL